MRTLTVFCSGKLGIKDEYLESVKKIIGGLDKDKIKIAYGGGNVGLMGVVRETFKNCGGEIVSSNIHKFVVGDLPDNFLYDNITQRQSKLIELGDFFLALPGGFGTLYELLEVITKNQIEEISKMVIIFNYKGIYDNLLNQIKVLQEEGFIKHDFDWYKIKVFSDELELSNFINQI